MDTLYEINPDFTLGRSAPLGSPLAFEFKRATHTAPPEGDGPFSWNGRAWIVRAGQVVADPPTKVEQPPKLNLTQLGFLRLLTAQQVGRWERRKKLALENPTPTEADDTVLQGDRLFSSTPSFNLFDDISQAVVYVMYREDVFGPFFDGNGEPTVEQVAAIEETNRVAQGLPPKPAE